MTGPALYILIAIITGVLFLCIFMPSIDYTRTAHVAANWLCLAIVFGTFWPYLLPVMVVGAIYLKWHRSKGD